MNRLSRLSWFVLALVAVLACSARVETPAGSAPKAIAGGDEAGNGGGIGEKNVLFVYLHLKDYLSSWLLAEGAALDARDRDLVTRIVQLLERRPPTSESLVFRSEREHPGTFFPDGKAHGALRSAVTGSGEASPIVVNVDHLYVQNASGVVVPLDLAESAALLLDELAHHVEPKFRSPDEHTRLDLLCAKLRAFLQAASEVSTPGLSREIQARALNFGGSRPRTQLLLFDSRTVIDLTEEVRRRAKCLRSDTEVEGLRLTNLHWHLKGGGPYDRGERKELHGTLFTYCALKKRASSARTLLPYERLHRANMLVEAPSFLVLRDKSFGEWQPREEYLNPQASPEAYHVRVVDCRIDPKTEKYILDETCH